MRYFGPKGSGSKYFGVGSACTRYIKYLDPLGSNTVRGAKQREFAAAKQGGGQLPL